MPNEKHEFSAGWRAAQKGGPAGCTTGRSSGLHIKAGWGLQSAPPFSAAHRTTFLCSPLARPSVFCATRQPAESSHFSFGNTALQPAGLPALQLVLSDNCLPALKPLQHLSRHVRLRCYKCHGQLNRTCVPSLSCDHCSQLCSPNGKIAVILPHKAK